MNPRRSSEARGDETSPLAWARHPLRALVLGTAALAFGWDVSSPLGRAALLLGVLAGIVAGERLGRSRYRLPVVLSGTLVASACLLATGALVTRFEPIASGLGSRLALSIALVTRLFAAGFAPVATLRSASIRRPALTVFEVVLAASGLAFVFAAHRGGLLARPLWLGDWSYRRGYDPAAVLLVIGGAAFVVYALLLAAENGRRTGWLTLLGIPLLAFFVVTSIDVERLAQLPRVSERDQPITAHGDRPHQLPNHADAEVKTPAGGRGEGKDGAAPKDGKDDKNGAAPKDGKDDKNGAAPKDGKDDKNGAAPKDGKDDKNGAAPQSGDASTEGETSQESDARQSESEASDGRSNRESASESESNGGEGEGQSEQEPPPSNAPDIEDPPPRDSPKNQEPMAIVLLGDDYEPPGQMFYLRQETWSQLGEHRLVPTTRPDIDRDVPLEFPARSVAVPDAPPDALRKRIRGTVTLVHQHRRPFALETPVLFAPVKNPNPKRFARAYRFESLAQLVPHGSLVTAKVGNPAWSEDVRSYYTRVHDDPRYADLARKLVEKLDPKRRSLPFFQALSVKLWMDQELTYSTRHRHANVPDPTGDFLFGDRTGYCVHFAHAAVYLWRSLGIPARVGVGYAVNAETREGSALMVQSGDGHAWPELYLEGAGWIVLDIAPKRILDAAPPPSDKAMQRKLAELARETPEPEQEDVSPNPTTPRPKLTIPWSRLFVGLAVAVLLALVSIKAWRRLRPRFAAPEKLPRVGYRAALDLLSEVGIVREEGETREAFARRVADRLPTFVHLTEWHIADAFGAPERADERREARDRARWKESLAELLRERRPLAMTRRARLLRLNPASFLASR